MRTKASTNDIFDFLTNFSKHSNNIYLTLHVCRPNPRISQSFESFIIIWYDAHLFYKHLRQVFESYTVFVIQFIIPRHVHM